MIFHGIKKSKKLACLCSSLAQASDNFAAEIKNEAVMRNTDYTQDLLGNMISSDTSFKALQDMIKDLDLELEDAMAL